jgi:hypothetical protein
VNGSSSTVEGWGPALLEGSVVLLLCWAGFLFVPDRLLAYLTTRVSPHVRDALVTAYFVLFFIALAWGFVRLQQRRGA